MNILVTGGSGFIGSNFIRYVLQTESDVTLVNLDALTYAGASETTIDVEEGFGVRYRFVRGDITDTGLVEQLLQTETFDGVLNFAAESHVDRSITDPSTFVRTNVVGTSVLLEAARKFHGPRFLQVSTDEVYGSLGPKGQFTEKTPLDPSSPYSASKAGADHLVLAAHRTFGQNVVITRCSNNYGPYQHPEKLIPLMIIKALHDQRYANDYAHVTAELNWLPEKNFASGLAETVRWYQSNEAWWRPIIEQKAYERSY
jgi:dTDP-glucose 4,6-dehydratase